MATRIGWKVKLRVRCLTIGVPTPGVASLLLTGPVAGHHAAAVYFYTSTPIEVRGIITGIKWQNPHTGFTLTARESGEREVEPGDEI